MGTSPCSSNLDKAIIVMAIVWPFAYAQGVQSSLTLGRNIMISKLKKILIACIIKPNNEIFFLNF